MWVIVGEKERLGDPMLGKKNPEYDESHDWWAIKREKGFIVTYKTCEFTSPHNGDLLFI